MAELLAGGLAIIIRSRFPENVGKVVKLGAFAGEINHPDGHSVPDAGRLPRRSRPATTETGCCYRGWDRGRRRRLVIFPLSES